MKKKRKFTKKEKKLFYKTLVIRIIELICIFSFFSFMILQFAIKYIEKYSF